MFELPFLINRTELEGSEADIQGNIYSIDNIHLFYKAYIPSQVDHCIIFYHGGGANHLSYTGMAESLRNTSHIATFLFDIRGHGLSDGPRGYCKSKDLIWSDINSAIQFVKGQYPDTFIYLAGHSSGAGLILNYACWNKRESVDSYLMIAPELGYRLAKQKKLFAQVNFWAFFLNKLSNGYFCSKMPAVRFNYPEEIIHELGFVSGYNVCMAEAVTPDKPIEALLNLKESLFICLASEDELINNEVLQNALSFLQNKNPGICVETIPHAKHVMILKEASDYIKKYINEASHPIISS